MWKMTVVLAIFASVVNAQPAQLPIPEQPKAMKKTVDVKRKINLMPLFSPESSSVDSEWKIKNGRIVGDNRGCARIEFPFSVPDEYDYNVTLSVRGRMEALLILSMNGKSFLFLLGNPWCLEYVSGKGKLDKDNPTRCAGKLRSGVPARVEVKVRSRKVEIFVDGELVIIHETNGSDLGENKSWALPHAGTLGIGSSESPVEVISAELVEVSGRGEKIDRTIKLEPPK